MRSLEFGQKIPTTTKNPFNQMFENWTFKPLTRKKSWEISAFVSDFTAKQVYY